MIVFNYEPQDVICKKHIAYFTRPNGGKIDLHEVYEVKIKHPQAPEHATVQTIETSLIRSFDRTEFEAGGAVMIEASQNALRKIMTHN